MATDFEDAKTSTFDSDSRKTIQLQQRNSGSDWEEQLALQASERFSSEPPGPRHAVNSLFIGSSKICMLCCIATSSSGLWHAKGCLLPVERCASCSRMQCSLRRSLCKVQCAGAFLQPCRSCWCSEDHTLGSSAVCAGGLPGYG